MDTADVSGKTLLLSPLLKTNDIDSDSTGDHVDVLRRQHWFSGDLFGLSNDRWTIH